MVYLRVGTLKEYMINSNFLAKICKEPGAPGYEQRIRKLILTEIEGLVDDVKLDALGNIIAIRNGSKDKTVMVAAHMDEIGFIVSHVNDNGFIKFRPLGGFDPKTLTAQRVIIHGKKDIIGVMGTKPIHVLNSAEKNKAPRLEDYFIDTGLSAEEVKQIVEIGNPITRERELIEMGDCVNAKSLDNRVSVFILIETLKKLKAKKLPYTLYAAFTVQEEVGLRGAMTAASGFNPDFAINLDVTLAYDLPGASKYEQITSLGKGTAIKILDGRTICDYRMVKYLRSLAEKKKIKHQMELLPAGGTDTAALQRHCVGGSIAGGISIPTRYLHQVIEMAHKQDIVDSISLLTEALLGIDQYDWSFN